MTDASPRPTAEPSVGGVGPARKAPVKAARKAFVGPRLRQLRRERGETQADMARALGVSAAYVNLLENNQRSVSVQVLMRLAEVYGVEMRDLVDDQGPALLAALREALRDPAFDDERPDLQELRDALDHCPGLARAFLGLHERHRALLDRVVAAAAADGEAGPRLLEASPESRVHDLFRRRQNHFEPLERAAERFRGDMPIEAAELYGWLRRRLAEDHGVAVEAATAARLGFELREYDAEARRVVLSDGLDYPNKLFQLAHVAGLAGAAGVIDALIAEAGVTERRARARCRAELANYFAAAVLMPYAPFLTEANESGFDLDHLAARFGVSFEQVCHRVTTLGRPGAEGPPFFFLRIDRAGNVTKRFNATRFELAEHGGACPRWDIHAAFNLPGRILTQLVETPDGARYFTINRTVERPTVGRAGLEHRLAVTLGCPVEHAGRIVYAQRLRLEDPALATPIGVNCRLCPRRHCAERAHQPLHVDLPLDERRRGRTRFES